MDIAEQIRQRFKKSGLSVSRLRKLSGVYLNVAQRVIAGHDGMGKTLEKLADALDCDIVLVERKPAEFDNIQAKLMPLIRFRRTAKTEKK